jgi:glyoxylase-like metal-dependent hydrolase (beta-lactamase superfamily II)
MTQAPAQQIPGVYHRRIGDIVVTAISDGYLDGSMEVLRGISLAEGTQILADAFRPARRSSVNTFAIFSAGRVALIDTGSGTYLGETVGHQMRNLRAAGIDPAAIDTVLLTHMHPDHSLGLTDRATGELLFPNAELAMHEREAPYWLDDANMARADERGRLVNFVYAREQLKPYADRMRGFAGGEVFPGVTALPAPGHTPGHTMYLVESAGQSVLIWGDIVHVPEIQIPRPEVTVAFDVNPEDAIASRRRAIDMVMADKLLIAGMHLHFPAFSRLVMRDGKPAVLPEPWVHIL